MQPTVIESVVCRFQLCSDPAGFADGGLPFVPGRQASPRTARLLQSPCEPAEFCVAEVGVVEVSTAEVGVTKVGAT